MITHVVLMKFKAENQRANMEEARARLNALRDQLSCLRHLEVGLNCVPSDRAFELALITRFDDMAGLDEYADHPLHVEVKRFLATVLEKSHVVDYES
jgi:hypothetical protein